MITVDSLGGIAFTTSQHQKVLGSRGMKNCMNVAKLFNHLLPFYEAKRTTDSTCSHVRVELLVTQWHKYLSNVFLLSGIIQSSSTSLCICH